MSFYIIFIIALLVLLVYQQWVEPFVVHQDAVKDGEVKYNHLTETVNLIYPALPLTMDGSQAVRQAISTADTTPTSGSYRLHMQSPYQLPSQSSATLEMAKTCEKAKDCSAFSDATFAANCGMSFDIYAVNSQGSIGIGGMFVSPDDRNAQMAQGDALHKAGQDPYPAYYPTIGQSKTGTFALNKDQCTVVKERIDCLAKQTFGTPHCTQCLPTQNFSRVGPESTRLPSTLHLFGVGSVRVSHRAGSLGAQTLNTDSAVTFPLPADSEGYGFTVYVTSTGPSPYLSGFLEGPTTKGPFRYDLFPLVQQAKPRIRGSQTVDGFRCIIMVPQPKQTGITLTCFMPFTFIDNMDGDALACPNGPLLTQASSATFLESNPCYGKTNEPGNYTLECLKDRWSEVGGDTAGTGYPADAARANAIQKDASGNPLDIDAIVNTLSADAASALSGRDAYGSALSIPDWNTVSMRMLGVPITSPCDGPNATTGPLSQACLTYLYENKGDGGRVGATYTMPLSRFGTKTETFANPATNEADVVEKALEGFDVWTGNKSDGTANPRSSGGFFYSQAQGNVEQVKSAYDQIHRQANDNTQTNDARADALKKGYGITLQSKGSSGAQDFDVHLPANTVTKSHADMEAVCSEKGMRLCNANEICDMSTRTVMNPDLTASFPGDNWIAVGDNPNEWLTLDHTISGGSRYCKTHTEVAGGTPGWGGSREPGGWERLAKCCPIKDKAIGLATPWTFLPGLEVPLRKNNNGDVECDSVNHHDCLWGQQPWGGGLIGVILRTAWGTEQPLTCGDMHAREWGGPGYDNPNHWCARALPQL